MERVKIGLTVDIMRTDRRIHSARVSCINPANRTVTVEWMEDRETKAKEVEIESILSLNPHLILAQSVSETPSVTVAKLPSSRRTGVHVGSSVSRPSVIVNPTGPTSPLETPRNKHIAPLSVVSPEIKKMIPSPPVANNGPQRMSTRNRPSVQPTPNTNIPPKAEKRRPNALKEVEKLERNREERRARLAECREERRTMMKKDPGNPNWEFSSMINEFRATLDFRPIRDTDGVLDHQISVCVRKRPMNKKELESKEVDIVTIPNKERIIVHEPKLKVDLTKYLDNQQFRFDCAFDENCDNERVYRHTARPLVQTIFEGGMATCFAYGQTGSGKTHTMGGEFQQGKNQNCSNGIYVLTATDVFQMLSLPQYREQQLVASASFFEIYGGKVFDLLNGKNKLRVLEDGKQQVQVVGLSEKPVESVEQVLDLIRHGSRVRTSGQTSANANSSRSHAVFQIILRNRSNSRLHGKFSLVDLAGNERGADTNSADRQTRMEGAEINKSLLALKECIRALGRKGAHLPFRASKLTQVLKDSFVGDKSKTCMIAMISPGMSSCEHSLNTLRYADRVKELAVVDTNTEVNGKESLLVSKNGPPSPHVGSISEEELSAELYSFHEAAFRLQEMEEDAVDSHKVLLSAIPKWQESVESLLATTDRIDFDVEVYVQQMDSMLGEMGEDVFRLKTKFAKFARELQEEDERSQAVKLVNNRRTGYSKQQDK